MTSKPPQKSQAKPNQITFLDGTLEDEPTDFYQNGTPNDKSKLINVSENVTLINDHESSFIWSPSKLPQITETSYHQTDDTLLDPTLRPSDAQTLSSTTKLKTKVMPLVEKQAKNQNISIIQSQLDELKQNETFKAILLPDETKQIYDIDNGSLYLSPFWHDKVVFLVEPNYTFIPYYELEINRAIKEKAPFRLKVIKFEPKINNGTKNVDNYVKIEKEIVYEQRLGNISKFKVLMPGLLAVGYNRGAVDIYNQDLNIVCRIEFMYRNSIFEGDSSLKSKIAGHPPQDFFFYLDSNNEDAYLAIKLSTGVAQFKLKLSPQGTFKVVRLLNEPKVVRKDQFQEEEKLINTSKISYKRELESMQILGQGFLGFKQAKDQQKDSYAMFSMGDRCTQPLDKQKAFKVINNFKFDAHTWVYPWGIDKNNVPRRVIIVSQREGVQIQDVDIRVGEQKEDTEKETKEYRNEVENIELRQQQEYQEFKKEKDNEFQRKKEQQEKTRKDKVKIHNEQYQKEKKEQFSFVAVAFSYVDLFVKYTDEIQKDIFFEKYKEDLDQKKTPETLAQEDIDEIVNGFKEERDTQLKQYKDEQHDYKNQKLQEFREKEIQLQSDLVLVKKNKLQNFLKKQQLPKDMQSTITDVKLLEDGKLIIVCNNEAAKTGGLFIADLMQETAQHPEKIRMVSNDQLNQLEISQCGRMLAILGTQFAHLWTLPNLEMITRNSLPKGMKSSEIKITSEQLFLKYEQGWALIHLKETKMSTTIKGNQLLPETKLSSQILYGSKESCIGMQVLPFQLEEVFTTKLTCERGLPLTFKYHQDKINSVDVKWRGIHYHNKNLNGFTEFVFDELNDYNDGTLQGKARILFKDYAKKPFEVRGLHEEPMIYFEFVGQNLYFYGSKKAEKFSGIWSSDKMIVNEKIQSEQDLQDFIDHIPELPFTVLSLPQFASSQIYESLLPKGKLAKAFGVHELDKELKDLNMVRNGFGGITTQQDTKNITISLKISAFPVQTYNLQGQGNSVQNRQETLHSEQEILLDISKQKKLTLAGLSKILQAHFYAEYFYSEKGELKTKNTQTQHEIQDNVEYTLDFGEKDSKLMQEILDLNRQNNFGEQMTKLFLEENEKLYGEKAKELCPMTAETLKDFDSETRTKLPLQMIFDYYKQSDEDKNLNDFLNLCNWETPDLSHTILQETQRKGVMGYKEVKKLQKEIYGLDLPEDDLSWAKRFVKNINRYRGSNQYGTQNKVYDDFTIENWYSWYNKQGTTDSICSWFALKVLRESKTYGVQPLNDKIKEILSPEKQEKYKHKVFYHQSIKITFKRNKTDKFGLPFEMINSTQRENMFCRSSTQKCGRKRLTDQPFFYCDCGVNHGSEFMVCRECGMSKETTLCMHQDHEWHNDKCSKCDSKQPLCDENGLKLEFIGTGEVSPMKKVCANGLPLKLKTNDIQERVDQDQHQEITVIEQDSTSTLVNSVKSVNQDIKCSGCAEKGIVKYIRKGEKYYTSEGACQLNYCRNCAGIFHGDPQKGFTFETADLELQIQNIWLESLTAHKFTKESKSQVQNLVNIYTELPLIVTDSIIPSANDSFRRVNLPFNMIEFLQPMIAQIFSEDKTKVLEDSVYLCGSDQIHFEKENYHVRIQSFKSKIQREKLAFKNSKFDESLRNFKGDIYYEENSNIKEKHFNLFFSADYQVIEKGEIISTLKNSKQEKTDLAIQVLKYSRQKQKLIFTNSGSKWKTEDADTYCTNHVQTGQNQFVCLGHTPSAKHGFGETNQRNFHGKNVNGSYLYYEAPQKDTQSAVQKPSEANLKPISAMRCDNGHQLYWTSTNGQFNCSICNNYVNNNTGNQQNFGRFECKQGCSYNTICERCGSLPKTDHSCEKGKMLVYAKHEGQKKKCNNCRKSLNSGYPFWKCKCTDHETEVYYCKKHGQTPFNFDALKITHTCEHGQDLVFKNHSYPVNRKHKNDEFVCISCNNLDYDDSGSFWRCECEDHDSKIEFCSKCYQKPFKSQARSKPQVDPFVQMFQIQTLSKETSKIEHDYIGVKLSQEDQNGAVEIKEIIFCDKSVAKEKRNKAFETAHPHQYCTNSQKVGENVYQCLGHEKQVAACSKGHKLTLEKNKVDRRKCSNCQDSIYLEDQFFTCKICSYGNYHICKSCNTCSNGHVLYYSNRNANCVEVSVSELFGKKSQYCMSFPSEETLNSYKTLKDFPTLEKLDYEIDSNIDSLTFKMSDGSKSSKAGKFGSIGSFGSNNFDFSNHDIGRVDCQTNQDDQIDRIVFYDRHDNLILDLETSGFSRKKDIQSVKLKQNEKICGFEVHNFINQIQGFALKIAKQNNIDSSIKCSQTDCERSFNPDQFKWTCLQGCDHAICKQHGLKHSVEDVEEDDGFDPKYYAVNRIKAKCEHGKPLVYTFGRQPQQTYRLSNGKPNQIVVKGAGVSKVNGVYYEQQTYSYNTINGQNVQQFTYQQKKGNIKIRVSQQLQPSQYQPKFSNQQQQNYGLQPLNQQNQYNKYGNQPYNQQPQKYGNYQNGLQQQKFGNQQYLQPQRASYVPQHLEICDNNIKYYSAKGTQIQDLFGSWEIENSGRYPAPKLFLDSTKEEFNSIKRANVCQGKYSACQGKKELPIDQPFWQCGCEDCYSDSEKLCWECAYFGRGETLGGFQQDSKSQPDEGMVKIMDLKDKAYELEIMTKKEVNEKYIVRDLVLHYSTLFWLVIAPDSTSILRSYDLQSYKYIRNNDNGKFVIKIIEQGDELQTNVALRQIEDPTKQLKFIETDIRESELSRFQGVMQKRIKAQESNTNQSQKIKITVSQSLDEIILERNKKFYKCNFSEDQEQLLEIDMQQKYTEYQSSAKSGQNVDFKIEDISVNYDCNIWQLKVNPIKLKDKSATKKDHENTQWRFSTDFDLSNSNFFMFDRNFSIKSFWFSPCKRYVILKIEDDNKYALNEFKYSIKAIQGISAESQQDIAIQPRVSVFADLKDNRSIKVSEDNFFIDTMNQENEDQLVFLGSHFFALPYFSENDNLNQDDEEEEFGVDNQAKPKARQVAGYYIHRLVDGSQMCFLPSENDFEFVTNSTQQTNEGSKVTGILDKKTMKVYEMNIQNFLHLGAKQLHCVVSCNILKQENDDFIKQEQRDEQLDESPSVLSLHAPGLFFSTLKDFEDLDPMTKLQMAQHLVLKSPVLMRSNTKVLYENLFQYFIEHNNALSLKEWLDVDSSFLANNEMTSPLRLLVNATAEAFVGWLETLPSESLANLLIGIGLKELQRILTLSHENIVKFFDVFVSKTPGQDIFSSKELVKLTKLPSSSVQELSMMRYQETIQDYLANVFFVNQKNVSSTNFEHKAYEISYSLIKFNLLPGSAGSKLLLKTIMEVGKLNNEIFTIKIIQQLLLYKENRLIFYKYAYITQYLLYIASIMTFPFFIINDYIVVLCWLVFQLGLEMVQIFSSQKCLLTDIYDYFSSVWNWLDIFRIIFMVLYIVFTVLARDQNIPNSIIDSDPRTLIGQLFSQNDEVVYEPYVAEELDSDLSSENAGTNWEVKRAEVFTILMLLSWLGFLQYLRLFHHFRDVILMIKECIWYVKEFTFILSIMIGGFSFANFYRQKMFENQIFDEQLPITQQVHLVIMTAFGEFEIYDDGLTFIPLFLFYFSCFLILIIMMNLLIGMISEKLAEVLEQKEKNNYFELCTIIYDIEQLLFWKRYSKQNHDFDRHFLFAEYQQQQEPWVGRVKATTDPIKLSINNQSKEIKEQNQNLDNKLDFISNSLEKIQDDIMLKQDEELKKLDKNLTEKLNNKTDEVNTKAAESNKKITEQIQKGFIELTEQQSKLLEEMPMKEKIEEKPITPIEKNSGPIVQFDTESPALDQLLKLMTQMQKSQDERFKDIKKTQEEKSNKQAAKLEAITKQNEAITKQNEAITKQNEALKKQNDDMKKQSETFAKQNETQMQKSSREIQGLAKKTDVLNKQNLEMKEALKEQSQQILFLQTQNTQKSKEALVPVLRQQRDKEAMQMLNQITKPESKK